jgi:hypothetical protein
VTAAQALRLQALTVSARFGFPLETVESWPQESHRTTIGDQSYDLDNPVLERLKADAESILSSERDVRPSDPPEDK